MSCGGCWAERLRARLLQAVGAGLALCAWIGAGAADGLASCRLKGVEHEARCGTLSRPLDSLRPGGPTIELHFAVLPALARQAKPDPVFFIAGGPGQSAIELAGPIGQMLGRLGQRRDIVLVDQRGTGRSAPLNCPDAAPDAPLRDAIDPQRQRQLALDCLPLLQALPHGDLRQFGTATAAADLDAVRAALGAAQINLVAVSYGTRVALEYLRQFPQRVRRVVLDGVVPPDMGLPQASAVDAQAAFDALLAACEAETRCHARYPRLRSAWLELLQTLPRDVQVPHPLSGRRESLRLNRDMLLALVRAALYTPSTRAGLPAAISAAAQGEFAPLVGLASALGSARGIAQGMHFSVLCSEDLPPADLPPPQADFDQGLAPLYRAVCDAWPRAAVPDAFRSIPPAPVPVLLWSGGLDPATPPRHAERIARALGANARHASVPQAGHGLLSLPCVRDTVFRFVDAGDAAAALQTDTGCARALPQPTFFVPPLSVAAP